MLNLVFSLIFLASGSSAFAEHRQNRSSVINEAERVREQSARRSSPRYLLNAYTKEYVDILECTQKMLPFLNHYVLLHRPFEVMETDGLGEYLFFESPKGLVFLSHEGAYFSRATTMPFSSPQGVQQYRDYHLLLPLDSEPSYISLRRIHNRVNGVSEWTQVRSPHGAFHHAYVSNMYASLDKYGHRDFFVRELFRAISMIPVNPELQSIQRAENRRLNQRQQRAYRQRLASALRSCSLVNDVEGRLGVDLILEQKKAALERVERRQPRRR